MSSFEQFSQLKDLGTQDINLAIALVPDSERVIVGTSSGLLREINFADEKPAAVDFSAGHSSYITGVAWTSGGVVSGGYDRQLIWWDVNTRSPLRTVPAHDKWIRRVVANPEGSLVVSIADDMHCKVWDAASGELRFTLDDHQAETPNHYPSMLYAAAFSADGKWLATGDKVGHVAIWNVATGEKAGELESTGMYTWDPRQRRHSIGGIRSLAFSHDGATLAVGGIGHIGNIDHLDGAARVELFDWQSGKSLVELADNQMKGLVEQLVFSADNRWLLTAGGDHSGFLTVYDLSTKKIAKQEKAHQHLHGVTSNSSGERWFTAHHGRVVMWSVGA